MNFLRSKEFFSLLASMLLTMAEKAFCIVIAVAFTLNFNWQTRVHGNTDTRGKLNTSLFDPDCRIAWKNIKTCVVLPVF